MAQYINPAEKAITSGKLVYGDYYQLMAQRDAIPDSLLVAHYQVAYRVSEVIESSEQYKVVITAYRKGITFPLDFYIVPKNILSEA